MRRLLCHEPRGHADMYGCFLVPPDDDGADLGVLFWHKDGYSTACGHGTIALGAWAVESGASRRPADGDAEIAIDVPSGRVVAAVRMRGGAVEAVAFRNVPSYVVARDVPGGRRRPSTSPTAARSTRRVPAGRLGPAGRRPRSCPQLIDAGRAVKHALERHGRSRRHADPRLGGIYGTILYEELGPLHQRNVTVFADGEVDRSPCGSGTSARLALLAATARSTRATTCATTRSSARRSSRRIVGETPEGVLTEVEGTAYRTGEHRFVLDPRDELGTGFVLR